MLDLTLLETEGLLQCCVNQPLFNYNTLNVFASQGQAVWSTVRRRIQSLLSIDNHELQDNASLRPRALVLQKDVTMHIPFHIEGYSDFYASEHHAMNVGKLFRSKEDALPPNWKFLPIGYNGRASTVFVSGKNIIRPKGLIKETGAENPVYSPSKKLDFELEMGFFIGVGNPDGSRIHADNASSHIFGLVLLNDWSTRDIQAFEYQPLGPFLSKNFATSISPWVVPLEALRAVMVPLPKQVPECAAYLKQISPKQPNIKLKVEIQPNGSNTRTTVCESSPVDLYWSMEQILAHHTVNHCIMKPGDLLGTGTISGLNRDNWGSMLEISFNGTEPIKLTDGTERTFLEDGDTVIVSGYYEIGNHKLGFGSVEGTVYPAIAD